MKYLTEEDLEAIRQLPEAEQKAAKAKLQSKRYYEAHREEMLAQAKAYREAHKEEIAAYQKVYQAERKAEKAAYDKAYRDANAEKIAAYQSEYYRAHREKAAEYQREYAKNFPEKVRSYQRRYYAEHWDEITERRRAYQAANREKLSARQRAYRAAKRAEKKERMAPVYKQTAALYREVVSLWKRGFGAKRISEDLPVSYPTVYRMLITAGLVETEESRLFASGMSVDGISRTLGLSTSYVSRRIPYLPSTPFLAYIEKTEE